MRCKRPAASWTRILPNYTNSHELLCLICGYHSLRCEVNQEACGLLDTNCTNCTDLHELLLIVNLFATRSSLKEWLHFSRKLEFQLHELSPLRGGIDHKNSEKTFVKREKPQSFPYVTDVACLQDARNNIRKRML